jgi:hypothetical protein
MNGFVPRPPRDIEQASRLLDVTNETQLEAYLRRLIDEVARRSGRALPAKAAQAVLAVVKKTAEQTLPTLAPAFGRGDGLASRLGSSPVATAARVYGLELEGLSAEDRDFEIARQLVQFAESAAHRAASSPAAAPDAAAVHAAVEGAAREFAPGLLPPGSSRLTAPRSTPSVTPKRAPASPGPILSTPNRPPNDSQRRTSTKGIAHV